MQKFQAEYQHAEKSAAVAKKNGWDGVSEGMLDYLNDYGVTVYRDFPTQALALAWLQAEIAAGKTLYACGDLTVLEQPKRRCRYCTCGGWLSVKSYIVEEEGIAGEHELSDECAD